MKKLNFILWCLLLIIPLTWSCSDEDDKTPIEKQTDLLVKGNQAWSTNGGAVTLDGDPADGWGNFTLNFTDGSYSTTGSPSPAVWPSSGTWEFINDDPGKIRRSDGREMTVDVVNNTLTIEFVAPWGVNGRIKSLGGNYKFTLK